MPFRNRLLTAGFVTAALVASLATPAPATPTATPAVLPAGAPVPVAAAGTATTAAKNTTARTSTRERRRVDGVKTPRLRWYKCYSWAECATVQVPLDYDSPRGKQTTLALLRVKARNQKNKIGSLFVNPGGPGAPATNVALLSPLFLSNSLLERFDIVGMDPRGIGFSSNVKCFTSVREQTLALNGMTAVTFPYGKAEEKAYLASARAFGKSCSTTGKSLAGAMSTAEVARDMDVMRRAVGDKKLTYLGFSYGSALGQYYANMFPDRFRAVAIDGVINPISWTGTKKTQNTVQDDRLRSADGAYRALQEILRRCDKAGEQYCAFAAGNPSRNFEIITRRLKQQPLVLEGLPGLTTVTVTYSDFIGEILGALYGPTAGDDVAFISQAMLILTSPTGSVSADTLASARTAVTRWRTTQGRDFPYENSYEAFSGVMCTDGLHPSDAASWPALTAKADKRAPYFGRLWGWNSAQCARKTWTVRDEDAYTGPFNRRTAAPVLVVGNYWDPATNYVEAVSSAKLLPNSRLLSSTNWGHTAYGTSACATTAIDRYLLRGTLPAKGTVCAGEDQPFMRPLEQEKPDEQGDSALKLSAASKGQIAAKGLPNQGAPKQLPPIAGRTPGISAAR